MLWRVVLQVLCRTIFALYVTPVDAVAGLGVFHGTCLLPAGFGLQMLSFSALSSRC